ncbi:MAG: Crp/Fnr family transcriptional regulator [Ferruginibacter sp.]
MNQPLILENFERHIQLTTEEQQHVLSLLTPRKLKKRSFLIQEGEVSKHTAFVTSGVLRGYTIDENGFEHILQFAPPGWWIADMYSLVAQQPGQLYIDALEDSTVLLLSKNDQEQLYVDIPKFERFFRILTENSLVAIRQRLINGLSLTAKQRYELFCKQYPSMINCLPQKQIAAYIGVTPEFLSKLLNEKQ